MNTQAEIKAQIALLKVEEKRLKNIQKIKDKNTAFQARMAKEMKNNPVGMIIHSLTIQGINQSIDNFQTLLSDLGKMNITIEKLEKRTNDHYTLLNLEQFHELLYCLDKEEWVNYSTEWYNQRNPFTQLNCCVCLMDKCETEMAKMYKKVDGKWVNNCACNTDICGDCIKLIGNKCPTCRTIFTAYNWVK